MNSSTKHQCVHSRIYEIPQLNLTLSVIVVRNYLMDGTLCHLMNQKQFELPVVETG